MKRSTRILCIFLSIAALVILPAIAAPATPVTDVSDTAAWPEVQPERADGFVDVQAELAKRAAIHEWLVSEMATDARVAPLTVPLVEVGPTDDGASVVLKPLRVGGVAAAGQRIRFDGVTTATLGTTARPVAGGAIRRTDDGGFVFTATISSPGAAGMRLHFSDFWMSPSSELYLFTMAGEVFGPYTAAGIHGDREFWSNSLMGDEVIVQIRHRGPATQQDLDDTGFVLADVGQFGPAFVGESADGATRSFCSFNAPCIVNNSCTSNSAVNTAEDAIAHYEWVSGAFLYICTGGLIADTDSGSQIPYFLTANHCVSRGKDARSVEMFFQFTRSCGTSNCPSINEIRASHPQSLRTSGSSIRATGSNGDYTLLELDQAAPAGSAFLGWSTAPVANSNGTSLYRISHPEAAPQAFSEHDVDTSAGTCQGLPRGSWIYSRDVVGGTEGGSSGSPVVNGSGQVVGQLTGACGTNLNDVCDAVHNATVDGAFAAYYGNVSQYLDSGSSCNPSPEVCTDGVDNDCDGAVDCNDSSCDGDPACSGPPTCGGNGASCSSGADCCSGNCKRGSCKGH